MGRFKVRADELGGRIAQLNRQLDELKLSFNNAQRWDNIRHERISK
jgi:hypothetical protein